jgi:hypothetical protein
MLNPQKDQFFAVFDWSIHTSLGVNFYRALGKQYMFV